jgi:hypothetical protein
MVFQTSQTITATQRSDIGYQIDIRPFHGGVKIVAFVMQVSIVPKEFGKEPRKGFSEECDPVDGQGRINGRIVVVVVVVARIRRIQSLPIVSKGRIDLFRQGLRAFRKYVG